MPNLSSRGLHRGCRPAQQCPQPRVQLVHAERLGDAVVRARVQRGDKICGLVMPDQPEYGYAGRPADAADDLDTRHSRQVKAQDEQSGRMPFCCANSGKSCQRRICLVAVLPKGGLQGR
jgi:hypothetical protein